MKTFYLLLLSAALGLVCCRPTNDPTPAGSTSDKSGSGTIKPVGEPLGALISKSIGPEGGIVASPDGRVSLTIPAGALKATTTISIQPITSTAPSRIGNGFRFSPHGQTFDKPVTITMAYEPDSLSSGQPQVLQIAYQNSKGIWETVDAVTVNERAHTVSVLTTHFSDYSIFESYTMDVVKPIIGYGEGTLVGIYSTFKQNNLSVDPKGIQLSDPTKVNELSNWRLEGGGKLLPENYFATYFAPAEGPITPNPVVISVEVRPPTTKGKLILFSRITVMGDELVLFFNGAKYTMSTVSAMSYGKGYLIGGGSIEKNVSIEFTTLGKGGAFGDLQKSGQAEIGIGVNNVSYGCVYTECKKTAPGEYPDPPVRKFTPGSVTFTVESGYVTGTFSGEVVNTKRTYCYDKPEFASISGSFRMKVL
ncbi:hypothetical protein GCM10023189_50990 [Nibrella saemangeumensis]|uniref:ZU5 domain-containing protein n=1 Tax=Nibrella saemangeumensis TaxID=1084526 RepID=A0ABP8NLM4_9BACT